MERKLQIKTRNNGVDVTKTITHANTAMTDSDCVTIAENLNALLICLTYTRKEEKCKGFNGILCGGDRTAQERIRKTLLQILSETTHRKTGGFLHMKATGIVRRIDDLGRVVIPKEIRRTMRIREGDPSQTTLDKWQKFGFAMLDLSKRMGLE